MYRFHIALFNQISELRHVKFLMHIWTVVNSTFFNKHMCLKSVYTTIAKIPFSIYTATTIKWNLASNGDIYLVTCNILVNQL